MTNKSGMKVQFQYVNDQGEYSTLTLERLLSDYLYKTTADALQWIQDEHDRIVTALKSGAMHLGRRRISQRTIGNVIRDSIFMKAISDPSYLADL